MGLVRSVSALSPSLSISLYSPPFGTAISDAEEEGGGGGTLRQWRTQGRIEIPAEIPFAHELLMKMLQENVKIKKYTRGTYF